MVLSAATMKAGMRIIGVWGGFYTKSSRLRLQPSPRSRRSKLGLIPSIGLGHCLRMIIHGTSLREPEMK